MASTDYSAGMKCLKFQSPDSVCYDVFHQIHGTYFRITPWLLSEGVLLAEIFAMLIGSVYYAATVAAEESR